MINILIVEDEFTIAMDIEQRLVKMGYSVAGIASDYNEAATILLENSNIDIAILDINLNSEKSGIDLGKLIKQKFNIPVIFLTAYSDDKTFKKAEEAGPMGYIIKPFKDVDIDHAIKIALQRFSEIKNSAEKNIPEKNTDFLFIKDKGNITKINIENILWLEAMDNYTVIYHKNGKQIVNLFLKDVLAKLDNTKFTRIHKSYAVAIENITSIEDSTVYINDKHLNISRKYKKDFFEKINLL